MTGINKKRGKNTNLPKFLFLMANALTVRANNFYEAGLSTSVHLTESAEFDYENLFNGLDYVNLLHAFFFFCGLLHDALSIHGVTLSNRRITEIFERNRHSLIVVVSAFA
jgi:hypothetical protein